MKKEIFKIMIHEHEIMESLLQDFQEFRELNHEKANELFQEFKWNIEKHMFAEEKMLYNVYSIWDGNIEGMFEILEQHGEIISLIKGIEKSYPDKNTVLKLRDLIKDHFVLEETVLYPNLEKVLNSKQKEMLIQRAQEIIRG